MTTLHFSTEPHVIDIFQYFIQNSIAQDTFHMLCGDKLGGGITREVYRCKFNPDWVLKFECKSSRFQNVFEWHTWKESQDEESIRKWLAPCHHISDNGNVLIQSYAAPVPADFKLPKQMPSFLTDFKLDNYGLIDGKLVCRDYGLTINLYNGLMGARKPRKAKWWSR